MWGNGTAKILTLQIHVGQIVGLIENQTTQIHVKIENEVTKRMDALFDGHKLTYEKQWEPDRKIDSIEKNIKNLEIRVS